MVTLNVNGQTREIEADPATPLLYVLRDHLELNGAKFGCGLGQCGACTVVIDGNAVFSCITPISMLQGRRILTLEGLGTCGFCIPGMIMRAHALLERNSTPSPAQIRKHMSSNLCRCGTHMRILRAVERAARAKKPHEEGSGL